METFQINNKEYVTISTAAYLANIKVSKINGYIKKGRLDSIIVDGMKLVELDSLHILNLDLYNKKY